MAERFELSDLTLPSDLPLSLPSRLVEQRPDIRAAEANLHSASAAVGVAIANQFPQITLTAGVSTQSGALDQLFLPGLGASTLGASVLQTVLDGGALAAKKKAAQAQLEQADAQYRSTVLTAFRNVADTLRALEYDAMTLQAAVASERAASTSSPSPAAASSSAIRPTSSSWSPSSPTSRRCWRASRRRPTASPIRRRSSRRWVAAGGIATTTSPIPPRG